MKLGKRSTTAAGKQLLTVVQQDGDCRIPESRATETDGHAHGETWTSSTSATKSAPQTKERTRHQQEVATVTLARKDAEEHHDEVRWNEEEGADAEHRQVREPTSRRANIPANA